MKIAEPGSISTGTLLPEDLGSAFLSELRYLESPDFDRLDREWDRDIGGEFECEIVDEMIDALNEHAPDGFYFGAHPGDGSDFGFWAIED